jgi:hypothetical protein
VRRASFRDQPVDVCVIAFSSGPGPDDDHAELIERCLSSVLERTRPEMFRLHVGCNGLSPRALALVRRLGRGAGARLCVGRPHRDANGRPVFPKYPLQRELFAAGAAPWVVALDDDSYVTERDWLERLEAAIEAHPTAHQFGKLAAAGMAHPRPGWIEEAVWRNPEAREERIRLADGSVRIRLDYVVGGFFALSREAIRRCSIPDPRLFHNGGDWTTGLALRHQGLAIAHHVYGVAVNAAPRRGMHDDLWQPPGRAADLQRRRIADEQRLFEIAGGRLSRRSGPAGSAPRRPAAAPCRARTPARR